MSWSWRILRAAVEQEILFPTRAVFDSYINTLKRKEEPFEVLKDNDNGDGSVTVLMRKRYNPQNEFLCKEDKLSHIKLLECVEELGPYSMPKVVLFNENKLTADEAFHFVQAGEYNDNIVVFEKRQWDALFKNEVK